MKKTLLFTLTSLFAAMLLIMTGCEKEGPVEEAAEETEEAVEETAETIEDETTEETLVEETKEELQDAKEEIEEETLIDEAAK